MKIRDIMVSEVETAEPDDTLDELAMMMREQDVGAIPVVENSELLGIVTDRDIVVRCIAEGRDPTEVAADEVISGELQTIEPDQDLDEARRIMAEHQIRRLPVVENGLLVGMVSLGDLAVKADEDKAADTLEEISEGVKATGQTAARRSGRKQPKPEPGTSRQAATRDRGGEQNRGQVARTQKTEGQGIASRSAGEEVERQNRVVPIRSQQKTNVRGDRSKSSSKRKAG
jgi:CBS domain-containing protein